MTVTTEQIQAFFKGRLYPQVDRHLLKRLSDDSFFMGETIIKEGKTSIYPKEVLTHLLAYVLTSECLFNLGLISRVKKKNVCFAAAKYVTKHFNNNYGNSIEASRIMTVFLQIIEETVPILTPDGYLYVLRETPKGKVIVFIERTDVLPIKGVEEKNISIMFPKICVAYFFILNVLNGTFDDCFYENYKVFIKYMTASETSSFGESLADFVTVNPTFTNFANKNCLATLTDSAPDNNLNNRIDDLLKLQNVLLLINDINAPMQKNNILSLFSFVHIFDNQGAWLAADVLRPALIKLNPAFASHNAKTLRLAAEFLTIANSI